jgi:hypothetical protein
MIKLKVVNENMAETNLDPFQKALAYHLKNENKPKPNMTAEWLGAKISKILKRKKSYTGAAISLIKDGHRIGPIKTKQTLTGTRLISSI